MNLQPTLQDDIVIIRPLSRNDFDRLYVVGSDPRIWEQHPEKDRWEKAVFQQYFDEAVASGSAFIISETKTNEVIGCSRYYDYAPQHSSIAIGYTFLACRYWGGFYNGSMKKLLIDHAFSFVEWVVFHVGEHNLRSQKALQKIGAKKIGERIINDHGAHFEFRISKNEWNI
jgi:RimJ/RimL family protein N-acetyltransferase